MNALLHEAMQWGGPVAPMRTPQQVARAEKVYFEETYWRDREEAVEQHAHRAAAQECARPELVAVQRAIHRPRGRAKGDASSDDEGEGRRHAGDGSEMIPMPHDLRMGLATRLGELLASRWLRRKPHGGS